MIAGCSVQSAGNCILPLQVRTVRIPDGPGNNLKRSGTPDLGWEAAYLGERHSSSPGSTSSFSAFWSRLPHPCSFELVLSMKREKEAKQPSS